MKTILTLFMLLVFGLFISMDKAEATLDIDADSFLAQIGEETVSLAPDTFVLEAVAEPVSIVLKWPHVELLSTGLDAQHPHDNCFATVEGRADRAHIRSGGTSRFQ